MKTKIKFANFRLDVETLRTLDTLAQQRRVSRSQLLRHLVDDASRRATFDAGERRVLSVTREARHDRAS